MKFGKRDMLTNLKNLKIAFLTQLVEYLHGKQKVAGSNPVKG